MFFFRNQCKNYLLRGASRERHGLSQSGMGIWAHGFISDIRAADIILENVPKKQRESLAVLTTKIFRYTNCFETLICYTEGNEIQYGRAR